MKTPRPVSFDWSRFFILITNNKCVIIKSVFCAKWSHKMNHLRFLGLLCGVALLSYGLYWGLEHHILALAITAKGFVLGVMKKVGTRAFWEHLPFLMGKWGLKSITKVIFIQIPKTLLIVFVGVLIGPIARRWLRVKIKYVTRRLGRYFRRFRKRCDEYFGVHGLVAFLLSLAAAITILVLSTMLLGFELIFWFGKWGPIGTAFTWITSGITRMFYGLLHTMPFLGRIFGWFGNLWVRVIAPKFPVVAAKHKRFVRSVLRKARRYHLITTDAHERMLVRVRRQKKEKESK